MPKKRFPAPLAGLIITCIVPFLPSAPADEIWIGAGTGNWSDNTRWLDGSAPVSDSALALQFTTAQATSVSANLDLGIFSLNRLEFNGGFPSTLQITASAGSALRFAGAVPEVAVGSIVSPGISAPIILAGGSPHLFVKGTSPATLSLSGPISEEGAHGLDIATAGTVQISGANTFSGGVELRAGNLVVNHGSALGSGTLTVRGGTLRFGAVTLANDATLHSDLVIADTANATWSGAISSAVANTGIAMRGGGTLTLTSASTYSGETTLDFSSLPNSAISATGPRITFSGSGSALQSSSFNVRAGSRLTLDATAAGATNRIADAAPVRLRSGELRFNDATGNAAAKSESVGNISIAGQSSIALASGAAATLTLNAAAVERIERGTLLAKGIFAGTGNGRLFSTIAPALVGGGGASGPTMSIIPWALGSTTADGSLNSFVTYTATDGFRFLHTTTDYATSLSAGASQNVRLGTTTAMSGSPTVNSLWLAATSVTGAGQTLTIASGAFAASTSSTFNPNLQFNAAEAHITPTGGTLTLAGTISGTNGLTKAGAGTLILQQANPFSGPLTINAGLIQFTAANQLGADTGAIVIGGTGAGLSYAGTGALMLARPLALNGGLARIELVGTSANEWTLSGGTQGSGGWQLVSTATGRIRLTGNATHTGPTAVSGGAIWFDSDAALGGTSLGIGTGTILELGGDWVTNRTIQTAAPFTLKTNGFNATLSGAFSGGSLITKTTPGNVRITSPSPLFASIAFDSGRLEIAGDSAARSSVITLTGGSALVLDNATKASNDRFAGPGGITIKNGELRLEGNATTPVTESINRITLDNSGAAGSFIISLTAPGSAGTTLQIETLATAATTASYPVAMPPLLIRGSQLGGAAGSAFTRVTQNGNGATTGFRRDALVGDLSGVATAFAIYDDTVDAAGVVGFRTLTAAEYTNAADIRNPSNGGTTPTDAHLLLIGAGTATGANNFAQTFTLDAGAALTLSPSQTLSLSGGAIMARSGAASSITGGVLHGGSLPFTMYLAGDLHLGSAVTTGAGQLRKFGPGTLFLEPGAHLPPVVVAHSGILRAPGDGALADSLVSLGASGRLALTAPTSLGGLAGIGAVELGSHTLTLGLLPADLEFGGEINGTGVLRIVDGGRAEARRTLNVNSVATHSGGVTLDSGVLVLPSGAALGSGLFTVNGGALGSVGSSLTLTNSLQLNAALDVRTALTLAPGASITGAGSLVLDRGNLRLQTLADFQGTVSTDHRITYTTSAGNPNPAKITIEGAAGSLRAQGGVVVDSDANLLLFEDPAPYAGAAGGRLADDAPLTLRGGTLRLYNKGGTIPAISETIGTLRIGGFANVTLEPLASGSTTLLASSLERLDRGTFEINAARTLGASGAGSTFVKFASAPATADGGVLPYAVAQLDGSSDYFGVVVHDAANGLRLLASGEYTTTIAAATPASHLLASSSDLVNTGALTVRTLSLGIPSAVLRGGGSLTISSGLIIGGNAIETVDNSIHFGANEGFIATPETGLPGITFLRPVTGSGGLTLYGRGLVSFVGGNEVTGSLVLNGSTRIALDDPAQLGPSVTPIIIHGTDAGAGFQFGRGSITVTRPIEVRSGYLVLAAPQGPVTTLASPISGPGGVFASSRYEPANLATGYTILTGANTYTGPTVIEGNVAFAADAALGNGGSVILSGGTIKLLGNWTTARRFEASTLSGSALTLDTNGFNATWTGTQPGGTFLSSAITKSGAGRFTIPVPQDGYTGMITVSGGEFFLNGAGRLPAGSVTAASGGAFVIDNGTQAAERGAIPITLTGGEFRVLGHSTQPTVLKGSLSAPSGFSTVTLANQPGAAITLDYGNLTLGTDSAMLLRGSQLGSSAPGATRIRFSSFPTPVNGIVPGVIADDSASGGGSTFATYDTSQDTAGVIGIRPLNSSELASGAIIRNPANGGATPTTANFLASGAVTLTGAANTLNTLTLDSSAQLSLDSGQALTLSQNAILVRSGAPAVLTGGTLQAATSPLRILGGGALEFGSALAANTELRILGPGSVTVTKPLTSRVVVSGGSLRPGAGDPLRQVHVEAGGLLDLNGVSTHLEQLSGTGTVNLANATLRLGYSFPSPASQFYGSIQGTGTVDVRYQTMLYGDNPFSGTLAVNGSTLTLSGTAPNITNLSIKGSQLSVENWDLSGGVAPLPAVPVEMSGGTLFVRAGYDLQTFVQLGTLTGEGTNVLTVSNTSSPDTVLAFANLARVRRGQFAFRTESGTAAFITRFQSGTDLTPLLIGNASIPNQRPVLPFVTFNGHAATFDPGAGVRALTASEKSTVLTPGANIELVDDATLNVPLSINSLDLDYSFIAGTGSLTILSGLVTGQGSVYVPIDFGAVEGTFFSPFVGNRLEFGQPISGSNGVTISGNCRLLASNPFTGPLTVNSGNLYFRSGANFGLDSSPIAVGNASLEYGGSETFDLTRGLVLHGNTALTRAPGATGRMNVSGPISGSGSLSIADDTTLSNTANSYSGRTTILGTVRFASDAVFGQSPEIAFYSGNTIAAMMPTADWTTQRTLLLEYNGSANIDTGGFTTTLLGPIRGSSTLFKSGDGRLVIHDGTTFAGSLIVNAGTMQVRGSFAPGGSNTVNVLAGARLEGNAQLNRAVTMSGTLAPGLSAGLLEMGNLTLQGGATIELELISATEFDQLRVNGTVTLNGLVQLSLNLGVDAGSALLFPILLNDDTDAIAISPTNAFAIGANVLSEGEVFQYGAQAFQITYAGGDGNDVALIVPEPGTAALLALGFVSLLPRRSRGKTTRRL